MKVRVKKGNNGLTMYNGETESLSDETFKFLGDSHKNGGIDISYQGKNAEVEGDETAFIDNENSLVVLGNMKVPGTNKKFKNVGKDIAKEEKKNTKLLDIATEKIVENNPFNHFSALSYNSGKVMQDAAFQNAEEILNKKQNLANLQQVMLNVSEMSGISPEKLSDKMQNGGKIMMKNGGKLKELVMTSARESALRQGVDPDIIQRVIMQESGGNPKAKSKAGALGFAQFKPSTAKQYGITKDQLLSDKPEDIQAVSNAMVSHYKGLLSSNNNDPVLALAAYNGGQGAVDLAKKQLGKDNITGQDWLSVMQQRRENKPSDIKTAWQNETYDYINNIIKPDSQSFNEGAEDFKNKYYQNNLSVPIPGPSQTDEPALITPTSNLNNNEMLGVTGPTFSPIQTPTSPQQFNNTNQSLFTDTLNNKEKSSLADRNRPRLTNFLGEIAAIADRPDFVQGQQYQPELLQPFQVSFQDQLNKNNSTFRAISRQLPNNPEALSSLAAQKYNADSQVLGQQFRTNQQIANQTTNQNTGILNDAILKNLQLSDIQYTRQEQAKAMTDLNRQNALSSISNKLSQSTRDNNSIRLAENLSNFRPNDNLEMEYVGPNANFHLQSQAASKATKAKWGKLMNKIK